MILFFYGSDSFRIHRATQKLKEKFITASLGDTNLSILDADKLTFTEFMRQTLALPFLSRTRLIIIKNILSEGSRDLQEKIGENLGKIPKTSVVLFSETKVDKRLGLYKKLLKADKVQEFPELQEESLKRWIKKEVEERGGQIESASILKLIDFIGSDLWRMSNELNKLIAYEPKITEETIDLLVKPKLEADAFRLTDALTEKNRKKAFQEIESLKKSGENDIYILSMINFAFRNLLILKDLEERYNLHSSWEMAKKAGLHPFVVQKTLKALPNFSLENLKKSYQKILDFDEGLKTGKIEGEAGIILLVEGLCQLGN